MLPSYRQQINVWIVFLLTCLQRDSGCLDPNAFSSSCLQRTLNSHRIPLVELEKGRDRDACAVMPSGVDDAPAHMVACPIARRAQRSAWTSYAYCAVHTAVFKVIEVCIKR